MKLFSAILPTLVLISSQVAAHADTFSFDFIALPNFSTPDDSLSFTLDTSQPSTSFGSTSNGSTFYYTNVPVVSNGITFIREVGFGSFFVRPSGFPNGIILDELGVGENVVVSAGGIYIGASSPRAGFFNYDVFLAGSPDAPVFVPGVYTYPTDGILTITDQTPTVTPEPSTFALFGTGLLGLAGLLRWRVARA